MATLIQEFRCRLLGADNLRVQINATDSVDAVELFVRTLPRSFRTGAAFVVVEPARLFSRAHYFDIEWYAPDVYRATRTTFESTQQKVEA